MLYSTVGYSQYWKIVDYGLIMQVRPGSSSSSSGAHDKTQFSRSELWTKDIIDYLQYLLDEFVARNNSRSSFLPYDRSSQMVYAGSMLQKGDQFSAVTDGKEPSPYFKWCYVVRIIQWQHAEGLLTPPLVIDWFLNQLQVLLLYSFPVFRFLRYNRNIVT